ncbi:MAG: hypothetical protein NTX53_20815 [candidate division WOR-3 bacterium]|nr:hypothetical protein [candidate division WOR-3 bacterium]
MRHALGLLLLMTSSVSAFETDYALAMRDPDETPQIFFHAELIGIGPGACLWKDNPSDSPFEPTVLMTAPYVGVEFHRARAGFGLFDGAYYAAFSVLPISIGYTIYERPVRYWGRLYGKVPDVYVKATARFANWSDPPPEIPFIGTMEAVCAVDCYGLGIGASVGLVYTIVGPYGSVYAGRRYLYPFAGVQVHLGLARIGF